MAGIFDSIKNAFKNPLSEAAKTGDSTPPPPAYKPPTEDPATTLQRNTQAATDKAAALEKARKARQRAAGQGAQNLVNQMRDNF